MKTSTIIILAAAGAGALLLVKRVAAPAPAATSPWAQFGAALGGANGIVSGVKQLWGSITGSSASSGYTVDAVDHQDDTIVPTPFIASSRSSIDLTRSSFSQAVPGRASLGM